MGGGLGGGKEKKIKQIRYLNLCIPWVHTIRQYTIKGQVFFNCT